MIPSHLLPRAQSACAAAVKTWGQEPRLRRQIPLTKGKSATVDAEDYESLAAHKWHAMCDVDGRYYAARRDMSSRKRVFMHRQILGAPPGAVVDHASGDTLDNTRANIRICSPRENQRNITSSKNQKLGGYKGIRRDTTNPNLWNAHIHAGVPASDGRARIVYLGRFRDAESAARRYDAAAIEYFGDFANTNFPKSEYTPEVLALIKATGGLSRNQVKGGYRGVSRLRRGGWTAVLTARGERVVHLGTFGDAETAARAVDAAAVAKFGPEARLNFPGEALRMMLGSEVDRMIELKLARLEARVADAQSVKP